MKRFKIKKEEKPVVPETPKTAILKHYSRDENDSDLDFLVGHIARISNRDNENNQDVNGLLSYLIRNGHWSPFEMVNICIEINTTRDIARQILRHRSFSFQEFSQRYAEVTDPLVYREARMQDTKNRQNSLSTDDVDLKENWEYIQREVEKVTTRAYKWAIKYKIAKEQARVVLPEGMTPSRMYMNGTLRSWLHYVELRTDPSTQKEHREVALACAKAIEPKFPYIMEVVSVD